MPLLRGSRAPGVLGQVSNALDFISPSGPAIQTRSFRASQTLRNLKAVDPSLGGGGRKARGVFRVPFQGMHRPTRRCPVQSPSRGPFRASFGLQVSRSGCPCRSWCFFTGSQPRTSGAGCERSGGSWLSRPLLCLPCHPVLCPPIAGASVLRCGLGRLWPHTVPHWV